MGLSRALCAWGLSLLLGCASTPSSPKAPEPARADPRELAIASTPAPLEPVLGEPTVSAAEVKDDFDLIASKSTDEVIQFVEQHAAPGRLGDDTRATIGRPVASNHAGFMVVRFGTGNAVAFLRRQPEDARAIVLARSPRSFLVAPLSWLRAVVELRGASEADVGPWYRALAQRLATWGRASGLVLFDNGNAMAVVVDLRTAGDGDVQLVAQTRFLRAGEFKPDAWGPKVAGGESVSSHKMNGHDGVSIQDVLRKVPREAPASQVGTTL